MKDRLRIVAGTQDISERARSKIFGLPLTFEGAEGHEAQRHGPSGMPVAAHRSSRRPSALQLRQSERTFPLLLVEVALGAIFF